MYRLRQLLATGLVGLSLVLNGGGAQAQRLLAGKADVYTVVTAGEAARFQVPQVRLPDAAAARRINRLLLRYVTNSFSAIDTLASPRRQLQQAARECCYDEQTKSWLAGGEGLTDMACAVLLNQNYLLSIGFQNSYQGLAVPSTDHFTFDLRTGRQLALNDLIADTPAQLGRRLQAAISRRLRDELAEVVANYGDSTQIADVAALYGIETWDTTPARGLELDTAGGVEAQVHLFEFALRPDALLLFYPVGMARTNFEFLPDEQYVFPLQQLHPQTLLSPVVGAASK